MRAFIVLVLIAAVCAGGYYAYDHWTAEQGAQFYRVGQVQRGEVVATVTATGAVEPVLRVLVGSQVSGTVVKWYSDFNQAVHAGDVLAELDQGQFAATIDQRKAAVAVDKARVEQARADLTDAELNLHRIEGAFAKNSATKNELGEVQARVDGATAALHAAEAQVEVSEAALEAAQIQLDKTIIRSPIDGVVISRDVDAGQTVAASLNAPTLFEIANDLRRMRVNAAVSETDIGQVRESMAVTFRVDAYPKRKFHGVVTQVRYAETVVDNVVTYETLIDVDNPDMALRPGMTAVVDFEVQRVDNVLKVPNAALRFDPNRNFEAPQVRSRGRAEPPKPRVYIKKGEKLVKVDIEPGITDGSYTQVRSGDLKAGQEVIVGWDLSKRRG